MHKNRARTQGLDEWLERLARERQSTPEQTAEQLLEAVRRRFERKSLFLESWPRLDRLNRYSRELLRRTMRALSERFYGASWHPELEQALWRAIHSLPGAVDDPFASLTTQERAELRALAEDVDGWWHRDPHTGREAFLGLREWRALAAREPVHSVA